MKIKKIPSPNYSSRDGHQVDMIVIHAISLPPGEFRTGYVLDLFLNRLNPSAHPYFQEIRDLRVSAHYFIDRGGEVIELVDPDQMAWHAGESSFEGRQGCNLFSIGIELEGTPDQPFTERQYRSLMELCLVLMKRYPLISPERIVRHSDIAPGRKKDPGPLFPWERFKDELKREISKKNFSAAEFKESINPSGSKDKF
ncbi:MAG: 1,6-anhydro-N-acetylmuramyl-L-alanine amidase AmpD [Deltaproteobacteria bacterium]|nr:MAG: 1,6-anhydro-N-acetylmuramyl-L-alanine amidase AmpD [Deltaproteobacteria bacterium]